MSVVAIVSESHCSGEEIAGQVADRLGYSLVGREVFDTVAAKFDISIDKVRRAMSGERTLLNAFTRDYERSVVYVRAVLSQMLVQQYFVYHGVASRLIPRSITHVLRVGVVGEKPFRVEAAVAAGGCDEVEARRRIEKSDERRSVWARQHLGRGFWEPDFYDLLIPRPGKTVDEAVEIILEAITRTALLPTDRSIAAQLDFLLSARVNVALLERGLHFSDVTADNGKVVVKVRTKRAPAGSLGRTVHALRQEHRLDEARETCRSVKGVREVTVVPTAMDLGTLLVDDERDYVVTLSERLGMRNIASDVAFDGRQALDSVKTEEPAVIVLDLRMPGMDGIDVLKRIRRDHPRVHVIVVTGHGTEEDEEQARALGAFDYLRKPVDITTLAARITEARQLHRNGADDPSR